MPVKTEAIRVTVSSDQDQYFDLREFADKIVANSCDFSEVCDMMKEKGLIPTDINVIEDDGETFPYDWVLLRENDEDERIATVTVIFSLDNTN